MSDEELDRTERKRRINWGKIGKASIEALKSISRGDIVLRLRIDRLFPFILHLFILAMASIWLSYSIEQTMLKMEKNKAVIETLQIDNAKKTFDLVELSRISTVEKMLKEEGSQVKAPDKPADVIGKR
ncbi:MAG: FtsL-like putative cell division protein [Candidatus Cryptobacteroides sp.]